MNRAPKVALVQDLSGFGRCSLTVALPVLAAMGSQCCPMLTAYLSAHTGFPPSRKAVFLDLAEQMAPVADHWAELNTAPDAVYSGFLGSAGQIDQLKDFIAGVRREGTLVLVDPVLGDHGRAYRTCTQELCLRMGQLAAQADVITPNLTEAALLLHEDYCPQPDAAQMRNWLERLSLDARRSVVITGFSAVPGEVGAACLDRSNGKISFAMARQERANFPGTGDLFASILLGGLLRGEDLQSANAKAVDFVQKCVSRTLVLGTPVLEGVQFEGLLRDLME